MIRFILRLLGFKVHKGWKTIGWRTKRCVCCHETRYKNHSGRWETVHRGNGRCGDIPSKNWG